MRDSTGEFRRYFINNVTRNFFNFNGRVRRTEYWMFCLFGFLIALVAIIPDMILDEINGGDNYFFIGLYTLMMIPPFLGMTAKRLHDSSKSGWWQLLFLIPLPLLWNLIPIMCMLDSTPGSNKWGENPKQLPTTLSTALSDQPPALSNQPSEPWTPDPWDQPTLPGEPHTPRPPTEHPSTASVSPAPSVSPTASQSAETIRKYLEDDQHNNPQIKNT